MIREPLETRQNLGISSVRKSDKIKVMEPNKNDIVNENSQIMAESNHVV